MCMKLPSENLNHGLYPSYLTSTYTYGVTIVSRVYDGTVLPILNAVESKFKHKPYGCDGENLDSKKTEWVV